ncbi:MAG TPA: FkbM family methyltransferase [Roseiflexaceae bacterium]|nr:FkbM family methyltransferase [Roseiflexaceae bacterium]
MSNPFEDPTFVFATSVEDAGAGLKLLTFPDSFRCYTHSSEQEVMLIYNEIFVKHEYLGAQIDLQGCRYVFDVGANIGLFTLFAKLTNPDLIVHAFEPIKPTYDVLVKNIELHGLTDVYPHNYAIGGQDGAERAITFYPNVAGNSTAHPESKEPQKRMLTELIGPEQVEYLFGAAQVHAVPTRTLSAVIDCQGIGAIDMLKIDVEGDELAVLQGIWDVHFPLIRQIAAEVHSDALLAEIQPLLARRGFSVASDAGIAHSSNMYATRR